VVQDRLSSSMLVFSESSPAVPAVISQVCAYLQLFYPKLAKAVK